MKAKLTRTAIQKTSAPQSGVTVIHDSATPGLCVRITANDSRTYYLCRRWQGKLKWVRLGELAEITLEEAQRRARNANSELYAGQDPNLAKREAREAGTLGSMWETYRRSVTKKARTMAEDEGLWRRYLAPWAARRVKDVTEEATQTLYNRIAGGQLDLESKDSRGRKRRIKGGKIAANRTMALLSGMFRKCARHFGLAGYNPAAGIDRNKETACERYLTAEELPAFWAALESQSELMRDLFKMALFTAQRRADLLTMRWAEINLNFATWTIPAEKMKGGKAHTVPLAPQAMEILKRRKKAAGEGAEWVFASAESATGYVREPKKALMAICDEAEIDAVTLHDLRRTTATWANSVGASEATIAAILAHKYKNVTGIYAKATADTMRTALEKAVNAIEAAGKGKAPAAMATAGAA